MQSCAIAYERFHMDLMKRGLVNQLCTTYMAFAMCFSIIRIFRCLLEWLASQPMPNFIFKYYYALAGWLGWSSTFGCLITINEVIFFTYWSKMWLKRVPNYNHDFLAAWLNVANITIAFYLGGINTYSSIEWAQDKANVPRVKIFLYLGTMIILQALVYMIHNLINCFKARTTNRILPIRSIQVFSVTSKRSSTTATTISTINDEYSKVQPRFTKLESWCGSHINHSSYAILPLHNQIETCSYPFYSFHCPVLLCSFNFLLIQLETTMFHP